MDRKSPQDTLPVSSDISAVNHCGNCGESYDSSVRVCPNDGTDFDEMRRVEALLAGRYQILSPLGSGGMGMVYKGRQQALGRMVAIKIMKVQDKEQSARFRQEAQLASMLDHPNLIRIYDFGTAQNDQPFMVMDFINGVDLGELIKTERGLLVHESLHIFSRVCEGMA